MSLLFESSDSLDQWLGVGKVTGTTNEDLYVGGYLFVASCKLFWVGYCGNGLFITPNRIATPKGFKDLFLTLPLDIHENIANRIWSDGKDYNIVTIRNNALTF